MIIIYHNNIRVKEVFSLEKGILKNFSFKTIAAALIGYAKEYENDILVWCHESEKENLNTSEIENLFHHNKLMLSYNQNKNNYFGSVIGYVEDGPFIKVNKKVTYPTWQMSGDVGVIHAKVLSLIDGKINTDTNIDYFLSSVAKLCMPLGLLCYSEPRLLKSCREKDLQQSSMDLIFRFVKQHYKTRWIFLLLLNLFLYERKLPIKAFFNSLFYRKRHIPTNILDSVDVQSTKKVVHQKSIDVIIPTIGRKEYLYDVLKDFSKQSILPNVVIIVEQNPNLSSESELDYLINEEWPFKIKHFFIHQSGACNARNIALDHTESEWVFLADDDNRFEQGLIEEVFKKIEKYGNEVVTTAYPQVGEIEKNNEVIQWLTFGAGNSFVKRDKIDSLRFKMEFEFGYGEDTDFGMQLRNNGYDILYLPEPEILHLKAPIGGFRTKPNLKWERDSIQPKPSPTVMLFRILHGTQQQVLGYKTILFIKYYKNQKIKNPFKYLLNFKKQWSRSIYWANELKKI